MMSVTVSEIPVILIYTILVWNIFTMATVNSEPSGGLCLSHAQYQCLPESTDLINAKITQPNNNQLICSSFGTYNKCIMNIITTCDFTEGERELYKTAFEDYFSSPPFNCHSVESSSEWKHEASAQADKHNSSSKSIHGINIAILVTISWTVYMYNKYVNFR